MSIVLHPQLANVQLFQEMESLGLIKRLTRHEAHLDESHGVESPQPLTNRVHLCYETPAHFGGHKLIHVTVYEDRLTKLTSHPHNEDFLLIGSKASLPLVLIVAKLKHEDLQAKRLTGQITADDFFCIQLVMNDPSLSFFTMMAGYPHAEVCLSKVLGGYSPNVCTKVLQAAAPSFFVTESAQLPEIIMSLNHEEITVNSKEDEHYEKITG